MATTAVDTATPPDAQTAPDAEAPPDARSPKDDAPDFFDPDRRLVWSGLQAPTGIAADPAWIYFADRDAGTILKCSHEGCDDGPVVLTSGQDAPIAVAVDATHLYWVTGYREGETGAPQSRPVFRCELPYCDAATVEPFDQANYQPYGIRVIGGDVYFAAWPQLGACPITGCADGNTSLGTGPAVSLDATDSFIYIALFGSRQIARCPVAGCGAPPEPLLAEVAALSVVVDNDNFYVADHDYLGRPVGAPDTTPNRILKCPLAGCGADGPLIMLSRDDISPYALADFGTRLFYTNVEHGTVESILKNGADPMPVD